MTTENKQLNHPVATGAALDSGHHQGLFAYDTTTGKCRFQHGSLLANTKQLANVGDAPTAHKTSHEYGGSDALAGQSIAGLRTSDAPTFAGLTSTGKISAPVGTTARAGLNIGGTGVAPTSPVDGDGWRLSDGVQFRLGANTRTVMLSETTQTISGAKTFSALGTFNLGLTVTGGKTTLAPAAAGYAPLNIPLSATAIASPVQGDIFWISGASSRVVFHGGGIEDVWGSSDTQGAGSLLMLSDSYPKTKAWATQLGGSNTLDFWNYASSTWTRRIQMSSAGGIGFFNTAAPTTRPTVNAACTDLATCIALTNQLRTHLIACGLVQ